MLTGTVVSTKNTLNRNRLSKIRSAVDRLVRAVLQILFPSLRIDGRELIALRLEVSSNTLDHTSVTSRLVANILESVAMAKTLLHADSSLDIVPPTDCVVCQDWARVLRVRVIDKEHLLGTEEGAKVGIEEVLLLGGSGIRRYPQLYRICLDCESQPAQAEQADNDDAGEDGDSGKLGADPGQATECAITVSVQDVLLSRAFGEASLVDHIAFILIFARVRILEQLQALVLALSVLRRCNVPSDSKNEQGDDRGVCDNDAEAQAG